MAKNKTEIVELLLDEFNRGLVNSGKPDFSILERCPAAQRRELRALMNTLALTYRALEPEREALHRPVAATG